MFVQSTVIIEDVDGLQMVLHTDLVVVDVVCRRDFQRTRAELAVHILVENDWDDAAHNRHHHLFPLQMCETLIFRMHTNRRITKDGFGTGCGHYNIILRIFNIIAKIEEFGAGLLVHHLLVRDGGQRDRIPVDHTDTLINQAFVVQIHKHLDNRIILRLVHGEAGALPVAGGAQFFQLFQNDAAVLLLPLPGMFHELVAGDLLFGNSLLLELGHNLGLRGDGGVVHSRNPTGVHAQHPCATDQNILDGAVEHVAHVQHAGDIGRRQNHRVGLPSIRFGMEIAAVHPMFIPFVFNLFGRILR